MGEYGWYEAAAGSKIAIYTGNTVSVASLVAGFEMCALAPRVVVVTVAVRA